MVSFLDSYLRTTERFMRIINQGPSYFFMDRSYETSLRGQFDLCQRDLNEKLENALLSENEKRNIQEKIRDAEKIIDLCTRLITSNPHLILKKDREPNLDYNSYFPELISRIVETTKVMIDNEKDTWDLSLITKICSYLDWILSLEWEELDDNKLMASPFFEFLLHCHNDSIRVLLNQGLSRPHFYLSKKTIITQTSVIKCAFEYPISDDSRILSEKRKVRQIKNDIPTSTDIK